MEGLKLSLDAHTLDAASGRQKVAYIDPEGALVYEEPKLPGHDLADQLARIWHELPEGLLDITEAKLAALPADDVAYQPPEGKGKDGEGEAERRRPGQALTHEEMHLMRARVQDDLNAARNELWFVLELAKTLSASIGFTIDPPDDPLAQREAGQSKRKRSSMGGKTGGLDLSAGAGQGPSSSGPSLSASALAQQGVEPPILPAGTYTATPASLVLDNQAHVADTYALQLALAAKEQAVIDCEGLIDAAVAEMQTMGQAADGFWDSVRALQAGRASSSDQDAQESAGQVAGRPSGQWAILPKPDFGGVMREGELARDVVIPYAVDEAPSLIRARCLAAFDLDPKAKQPLAFGARTHLRLRVTIQEGSDASPSSSTIPPLPSDEDVRAMMQVVQDEAFDEELFAEIRAETLKMGGTAEGRTASLDLGPTGQTISFELYDSRHPPSTVPEVAAEFSAPTSDIPRSDTPDLILLAARYQLLQVHRHRKAELVGDSSRAAVSAPAIVLPIAEGLMHFHTTRSVRKDLTIIANALERVGLVPHLRSTWGSGADSEASSAESGLAAVCGLMTETISLEVDGLKGLSIVLSPGSAPLISTSIATYPADPSEILSICISDIAFQLLPWAKAVLAERLVSLGKDEQMVFYDGLDGSILLDAGNISFELADATWTACPDADEVIVVRAYFEPYKYAEGDDDELRVYPFATAREWRMAEGRESLRDWLCGLIQI